MTDHLGNNATSSSRPSGLKQAAIVLAGIGIIFSVVYGLNEFGRSERTFATWMWIIAVLAAAGAAGASLYRMLRPKPAPTSPTQGLIAAGVIVLVVRGGIVISMFFLVAAWLNYRDSKRSGS